MDREAWHAAFHGVVKRWTWLSDWMESTESIRQWTSLVAQTEEFAWNAVDLDSIFGLERSPGEANDYPLQYSCLENSMDRGAWWATVHRVTKSWTGLSNYHFHFFFKIFGNNGYPIEICFFLIGTSQCNLDKLQRKKSVLLSSGKSKYLTFKTDDQDLGNFISVFNSSADNINSFIPPMLWPYHPKVTVRNSDSLWK